jgi:hypothetical protein
MALADIPFLGGYQQQRAMNQQQPMQELQQVSGAMGLMGQIQKQQQEAQFRSAMAAAKTPEEQVAVAVKFGGPEAIMKHADRQATREQTAASERARIQAKAIEFNRGMAFKYAQLDLAEKQGADKNTIAQYRLMLDAADKQFKQEIAQESLKLTGAASTYNYGAAAPNIPSLNMPAMPGGAQPSAAPIGGALPAGVPESDRAAFEIARAGGSATADRQLAPEELARMAIMPGGQAVPVQAPQAAPAPVQMPDAANLDARDLMARQAASADPGAPAAASVPSAAPAAPTAPQRPPEYASWPQRKRDEYDASIAKKSGIGVTVAGGRESVYVQRMMMGANQAAKDLGNVVQLPLTASTGIFGGRKQGSGLFDATKEILANKATTQEAQAYNAMATGFQRSLAQIESAGLMPSGSLTHQMDAVLFKEGDTNLTKLHKLAQTRQIVEAGMEVINSNPRVSPPEKEKVKEILSSIRKSVPFTHSDLIQLQIEQDKNPKATLGSILKTSEGKWSVVR